MNTHVLVHVIASQAGIRQVCHVGQNVKFRICKHSLYDILPNFMNIRFCDTNECSIFISICWVKKAKLLCTSYSNKIMPTGVKEQHALHGDSATRECSPGVSQCTSSSSREEHLLTMDKQDFSTSLSPSYVHSSWSRLKWAALKSMDTLPSPVGT